MITTNYSNFVEFSLSAPNNPRLVINEPDGWREDGIEFDRSRELHGIFTKFTNKLTFFGNEKEYILSIFELEGIDAELILHKRILADKDGEVKWYNEYSVYADFKTLQIKDQSLTVKFNSNKLAEQLKTNQGDEFEIERLKTVDGFDMDPFQPNQARIQGRSINLVGESILRTDPTSYDNNGEIHEGYLNFEFGLGGDYQFGAANATSYNVIPTEIITRGNDRHSSVDTKFIGRTKGNTPNEASTDNGITSSNMFFVRSTDVVPNENITVTFDLEYEALRKTFPYSGDTDDSILRISVILYNWNGSYFDTVSVNVLKDHSAFTSLNDSLNITGSFDITDTQGLALVVTNYNCRATFTKNTIKVNTVQEFVESPNLSFAFTHDVCNRVAQIISNRSNAFYSKLLGRTELGYEQDGWFGLIGMISGYWVRAFQPGSDKYKSLTISFKDLRESIDAVTPIGVTVEDVNGSERIRIESLDYFYRQETAIVLTESIYEESRKLDGKAYYSAINMGYSRGGDYEDSQGLDEPNTRTNWVTMIRAIAKTYKKIAKVRTDEYGLENLRRKPQSEFPDEDTRGDSDNWFLDLKRSNVAGFYEQNSWDDRLEELPTGIHSPETYRSMIFTPLQMFRRHAKWFMTGMETQRGRLITYANAVANSILRLKFIGESDYWKENQDINTNDLDLAVLTPWEIKFKYPTSPTLLQQLQGTTRVLVEGEYEEVSNLFFKIEFTTIEGEVKKGYIKNVKIRDEVEFTIIEAR